jgi:glutathione S-transferase
MEIKPEFGFVGGVVCASMLVHNVYMVANVIGAREKYGVKYPDLYATKENQPDDKKRMMFNCAQRGHQNSLEALPTFYAMLVTAGLKYPVTAAAAGGVYVAGKVLYFNGYASGDPEKRHQGAIAHLGNFILLGTCGKMFFDACTGRG